MRLTRNSQPPTVGKLLQLIVQEQLNINSELPCNRPFKGEYDHKELSGNLWLAGKVRGVRDVRGVRSVHAVRCVRAWCAVCAAVCAVCLCVLSVVCGVFIYLTSPHSSNPHHSHVI